MDIHGFGFLTMKPGAKQDWLRALRSKEYKQYTVGALVGDLYKNSGTKIYGTGFCCLGVFCEIQEIPKNTTKSSYEFPCYDGTTIVLSGFPHMEWFAEFFVFTGLDKDKNSAVDNLAHVLSRKNDNQVSFFEIADWIEINL